MKFLVDRCAAVASPIGCGNPGTMLSRPGSGDLTRVMNYCSNGPLMKAACSSRSIRISDDWCFVIDDDIVESFVSPLFLPLNELK